MAVCPGCGTENIPDASFCGQCGRPLEGGDEAPRTEPLFGSKGSGSAGESRARVVAAGPDGATEAHPVGSEVVIGRDEGTLGLHDPALSGRHARVRRRGDRYVLEDLGSTNGVFVSPREPTRVRNGDLLLVGETPFRFVFGRKLRAGPAFVPILEGGRDGEAIGPGDPGLEGLRLHLALGAGRGPTAPDAPEAAFLVEAAEDAGEVFVRMGEARELADGDRFVAGSHTFRFERAG